MNELNKPAVFSALLYVPLFHLHLASSTAIQCVNSAGWGPESGLHKEPAQALALGCPSITLKKLSQY